MSNNIKYNNKNTLTQGMCAIRVLNTTRYSLYLEEKNLESGIWWTEPPSIIKPYTNIYFEIFENGASKIRGNTKYQISKGFIDIFWSLSSWEWRGYNIGQHDPENVYDINILVEPRGLTVNILETR